MITNPSFEIVDTVGEYFAVPVGDMAKQFNGIITLTEAAVFLLEQMRTTDKKVDDLIDALLSEYDITYKQAKEDVMKAVETFSSLGLVIS